MLAQIVWTIITQPEQDMLHNSASMPGQRRRRWISINAALREISFVL